MFLGRMSAQGLGASFVSFIGLIQFTLVAVANLWLSGELWGVIAQISGICSQFQFRRNNLRKAKHVKLLQT